MTDQERPDPKAINWEMKDLFRKDFSERAKFAFLLLSFGIGLIAFLVPIVLPLVGGYDGHYSISFFYHVPATNDLFVGLLWAVGIFLFLFQGLSRWENILLSVAGIFLILVAMVPTTTDQCNESLFSWHAAFAVAFFACLFVVAIFFAKKRLSYILWPPMRKRFERAYNLAGGAMILLPLAAYGVHVLEGRQCGHVVFWIEAFAIWAFSAYWFVKTWEYKRLLGLDMKDIAAYLTGK